MEKLEELQKNIRIRFDDIVLLQTAFTHRSFLNEKRDVGEHNERLEFLGDAVLELASTEFLFKRFPTKTEGELTAYRAALVRTESISEVASKLGFNDCLRLSRGESRSTGKARHDILANAFEAFLGALYIEKGYKTVCEFLEEHLLLNIDIVLETSSWRDAKSYVQERAQEVYSVTPHYETISEDGPDHDREFIVAIFFGTKKVAEGSGRSKKNAEQDAANNALQVEGWE